MIFFKSLKYSPEYLKINKKLKASFNLFNILFKENILKYFTPLNLSKIKKI
jgi:hypothetical protein